MACHKSAGSEQPAESTSKHRKTDGRLSAISRSPVYKVYRLSYNTGVFAIQAANVTAGGFSRLWKFALSESFHKISDFVRSMMEFKKSRAGRGEVSITRMFFHFGENIGNGFGTVKESLLSEGPVSALETSGRLIGHSAGRFWEKNRRFFNYAAPVVGLAVLALTIYFWSDMTFALGVDYNGKSVGVVACERDFRNAMSTVEAKVSDASGKNFSLNQAPVYKLEIVPKSQLQTGDSIYDNLLSASGSEVARGYGLYIDGKLVAAHSDSSAIQAMLDGMIAPYKNDTQNQQVSFSQNVSIKSGVFPKNAIMSVDTMKSILTAQVPAAKDEAGTCEFDISDRQLYAMNASVGDSGIIQGQTVKSDAAAPILTVKLTRNETELQDIPYSVENVATSQLKKGKTQVATDGQNGQMQIIRSVTYDGGKVVDSKIVSTTLLKAPVTQKVLVGTASSGSSYSSGASSSGGGRSLGSGNSGDVVSYAENYIGVQYLSGGATPGGFDCSGFTQYVYAKMGVSLSHSAAAQAGVGVSVSQSGLQSGDLVFFDTNGGHDYINHVGIYVGGGNFIEANSTHPYAVTISSLNSSYWQRTYVTARRVLN